MNHLLNLVTSMLDDEYGINQDTYYALQDLAAEVTDAATQQQLNEVLQRVNATEGRFYISAE